MFMVHHLHAKFQFVLESKFHYIRMQMTVTNFLHSYAYCKGTTPTFDHQARADPIFYELLEAFAQGDTIPC